MAVATITTANLSPNFEHEGELEYEEDLESTAVMVCSSRRNVRSGQVGTSSEYDEEFEEEGEDQHASYDDDSFEVDKDLSTDQPTDANPVFS